MIRKLFRGWKAGVIFIVVGLLTFLIDFSRLGSYDIYNPTDWPGSKSIPFLLTFLFILLGIAILVTELNDKKKRKE